MISSQQKYEIWLNGKYKYKFNLNLQVSANLCIVYTSTYLNCFHKLETQAIKNY